MYKELKEIIKSLKGNVLTVCVSDQDVLSTIDNNKKITNAFNLTEGKRRKLKKEHGTKNVKLKKLKKEVPFELNYVICDVNGINLYLRSFISRSYDLCNKEIIFYGMYDEYDVDILVNKYERYECKVIKKIYDKYFILRIDVSKIKISVADRLKNGIKDFFKDILEAIGNSLMQ